MKTASHKYLRDCLCPSSRGWGLRAAWQCFFSKGWGWLRAMPCQSLHLPFSASSRRVWIQPLSRFIFRRDFMWRSIAPDIPGKYIWAYKSACSKPMKSLMGTMRQFKWGVILCLVVKGTGWDGPMNMSNECSLLLLMLALSTFSPGTPARVSKYQR